MKEKETKRNTDIHREKSNTYRQKDTQTESKKDRQTDR